MREIWTLAGSHCMTNAADRRRFIKSTAALAALAALRAPLSAASSERRLAIQISSLPAGLSFLERFRIAADAGFSGVEMGAVQSLSEAALACKAAEQTGLRIHSVADATCRRYPLSSADPDVVRKGVDGIETALRNARLWGADAVSIVPAARRPDTSYRDTWHRSQSVIRERVLPVARDLGVVLAVEKIWDEFLVAPSELARYVDAFDSPWVKAAYDASNIVFYARHQDWIRILGPRLVMVRIASGCTDLAEARRALEGIDYDGWVTAGCRGTNEIERPQDAQRLRSL